MKHILCSARKRSRSSNASHESRGDRYSHYTLKNRYERLTFGIVCDIIDMDINEAEERARIIGFKPAPTSLLQAIERIDMVAEDSGLEKEELKGAEPEINYLAERVGINAIQAWESYKFDFRYANQGRRFPHSFLRSFRLRSDPHQ